MQVIFTSLAIIIRILTNSLTSVFQKKLTLKKEEPSFVNFGIYFILAIASIISLFFLPIPKLQNGFWAFALLGGITGAICNYFMVEALKFGKLSILGPINSYKAIVGMIFAIFLLGEFPNILGLIGILLIIFGSYFIFDSLNFIEIFKKKEIRYRFYALVFSAIEAVFIKKVILLSSVSISVIVSFILGAIFSYFIFTKGKFKQIKFPKKSILFYILSALSFGLMTITTAYVFKHIGVAYALSLFQLSVILNIILGWKIFREKDILKKLIGAIIIISGAIIIIFNS
ncbi:EamA family transporter [bacterium]|nr:EamA family transporter [bacterium]